jgi:hypothetical protein
MTRQDTRHTTKTKAKTSQEIEIDNTKARQRNTNTKTKHTWQFHLFVRVGNRCLLDRGLNVNLGT